MPIVKNPRLLTRYIGLKLTVLLGAVFSVCRGPSAVNVAVSVATAVTTVHVHSPQNVVFDGNRGFASSTIFTGPLIRGMSTAVVVLVKNFRTLAVRCI